MNTVHGILVSLGSLPGQRGFFDPLSLVGQDSPGQLDSVTEIFLSLRLCWVDEKQGRKTKKSEKTDISDGGDGSIVTGKVSTPRWVEYLVIIFG